MLHANHPAVKPHLLKGAFGLEKEALRIDSSGRFAKTPQPLRDDEHIVKDFCENQTEINTGVHHSVDGAIEELQYHHKRLIDTLRQRTPAEYLWIFSNPPYIENEDDIPIAIYSGADVSKYKYREYLSEKYGRYKMTFSGIHVNFSFDDEARMQETIDRIRLAAEIRFLYLLESTELKNGELGERRIRHTAAHMEELLKTVKSLAITRDVLQ